MSKATFLEFNLLLQKLLVADFDYDTACISAMSDWLQGCNASGSRMRLEQFALFLFDLTVIWCRLNYSS